MRKSIYALSGDPIHKGHIDIVRRVIKVFDEVIVGVGAHPDKSYLFSLEERMEMARRSLSQIRQARVVAFEGLLVDYAYEQGIHVIVKGVRNANDFDYENILHLVGESQELGVDTYVLFARPELVHVSSSAIKALQKEEGFIHQYVPLYVKECLEARVSGQYILGVTGEIGSGKPLVSDGFYEQGKAREISVHTIDLDILGNQILEERQEPSYLQLRERVVEEFGEEVRNPDGTIHRKNLGEIVYQDYERLSKLNKIMDRAVMVRLRKELRGKRGLVLLNGALIAESNLTHLCNNNIVLVTRDKGSQERRLRERGFNRRQISRRLASQYSEKEKKNKIRSRIEAENHGRLWILDNSDLGSAKRIGDTFDEIVRHFGLEDRSPR
jgi:pantetheine-phosphate adenylyltransferase